MAAQRRSFWNRAWSDDTAHRPAATGPKEPDWAEMGTAFGLEAAFVDLAAAGQPAQPAAPAPAPAPRKVQDGPLLMKKDSDLSDGLWALNRLNGRSVI